MNTLAYNIITLTCPSCAAKLKLVDSIQLLVCASCGDEHMVHRSGGAIYLASVAQDVRQIHAGVDKTAAQWAITRLTNEIKELDHELDVVMLRTDDEWVDSGPSKVNLSIGALFALLAIGALLSQLWIAAIPCAAIAAIIWFLAIKSQSTYAAEIITLRSAAIDRLNAALRAKHDQLQKHRQIAEG